MNLDEQNACWLECLSDIEKILSSQQYDTWVRPILFQSIKIENNTAKLKITAPNKFKQKWLKQQLESTIQKWMEIKLKCPTQINIGVDDKTSPQKRSLPKVEQTTKDTKSIEVVHNARLNADCTFESFVLGKANQLARAAAQQICENPGSSYNPFFLYGGVGLGKTH